MAMRMEQTPQVRKATATVQIRQQAQIEKIVEQQQQTAIIIERVLGRLDAVEHWQDAEERAKERRDERRDERDEKKPDNLRNAFGTYGGCLANIIYAGMTTISLLIGTAGLIIAIVKH